MSSIKRRAGRGSAKLIKAAKPGLAKPGSVNTFRTSGTMAVRDYYTHPESVQVIYRPVVAQCSVDGKGKRLDRNRLPGFPAAEEILTQSTEEGKWWHLHLHRCRYGWTAPNGVWINPVFYFYLNFVTIPITEEDGTKRMESPLYSDSDHDVFDWIYWLMHIGPGKWAEDGIITKGRRKHWSYITHCGFFLYYFCFSYRGDLGIAYDVKQTREQGQRLFEQAYNLLPKRLQHAALDRSKDGEITAADVREDTDFATGKIVRTLLPKNTIVFRETDKTPDAFRGMNLGLALIDEAGKYRRLKKVITATKDCLRLGTRKHGTQLVGGTSDAIDNKSKDYEKQWKIAEKLREWRRMFIPAWKIAPPHWDAFTGKSLRQFAEKQYLENRAAALAAGDTEGYYKEIQENPMRSTECFHSATLSNYPAHKLYNQSVRISTATPENSLIRGRLEFVMNVFGEIIDAYFEADTEFSTEPGNWLFHPAAVDKALGQSMPHLHTMAVDDVYKDPDEIVDSDSLCAMTVFRRLCYRENTRSNLFIASYIGRPARAMFAREVHKAMLYFKAKTLIENNDVFLKGYLLQKQLQDDLLWINGQVGIRNSDESLPHQELLAQTWMDEHGLDDCWFPDIIQGFKVWRQANTDTGSAAHMNFVVNDSLKDLPVRTVTPDNQIVSANVLGQRIASGGQSWRPEGGGMRDQSAIRRAEPGRATLGRYRRAA